MTTEHQYAHILRAIADGETVQWQDSPGSWLDQEPAAVLASITYDSYSPARFRIKPRTININGYEVPEPVREPLELGTQYWLVQLISNEQANYFAWRGEKKDKEWLADGRIHLTKEAAELHIKALLSFTAKK